ncbi:MAG: hypothetical protein Fur002_22740 [Anaerolineales bacterium]
MTSLAFSIYAVLSVSLLTGSFYFAGLRAIAQWAALGGGAWLLAARQRVAWASSAALVVIVALGALGLWLGLPPGWLFMGGVFALNAWDMDELRRDLIGLVKDNSTRMLERRRILRGAWAALGGLILASGMMALQGAFSSAWSIFFLTAAFSLGALIFFTR